MACAPVVSIARAILEPRSLAILFFTKIHLLLGIDWPEFFLIPLNDSQVYSCVFIVLTNNSAIAV